MRDAIADELPPLDNILPPAAAPATVHRLHA
jgi:hypothetical protein